MSILAVGDGKYRMFLALPPAAGLSSAMSTDGITWTVEPGTRLAGGIVGRGVLQLPDGRYRMYFIPQDPQAQDPQANVRSAGQIAVGAIYSAISSDAYTFTREPGTRVAKGSGDDLDRVGVNFPTVVRLAGGSYLMVYEGFDDRPYALPTGGGPPPAQRGGTEALFWAVSPDGLTFTKKGIAIDSRSPMWQGHLASPYLVTWDDGSVRLFFFGGGCGPGCAGIWHVTYTAGTFAGEPELDLSSNTIADHPAPGGDPNPPGDPAVAKIAGTWFIYFDQHLGPDLTSVFTAAPCGGPCPQHPVPVR